MTEETAKTKWCPMVRIVIGHKDDIWQNRAVKNRAEFVAKGCPEICCIASDCMMWRWELTREEAQNGYQAKKGYCGFGGKP